jgi:hypothetical protein
MGFPKLRRTSPMQEPFRKESESMRKTIHLWVRALAPFPLLVLLLAACGGSGSPQPPVEFKSETGGFSITTPYALKETTQSVDTEAGKIEIHMFSAEQGQQAWMVGYSDYPPEIVEASDAEGLLGASRDGAVSNVNGELVSDAPVSLNEHPGREFTASAQGLSLRARIFLVENRLYQIMAVVPKGQENSEEVDRFLQSFQLIGK